MKALKPAYGRDYKTREDAVIGFRSGHTWLLLGSKTPTNIEYLRSKMVDRVELHYGGKIVIAEVAR